MIIKNAIKLIREKRHLTQDKLAEIIQVSRNFICEVEKGTKAPSWKTLNNLSTGLDMKLSSIIRIAELLEEGVSADSPEIEKLLNPVNGTDKK
jgi:DNA-binding XRE family transcriptional regulator